MSRKKALILILLSLEIAIIIPLALALSPITPRTRHINLNARKYGYSPARIVVNKGDTVILYFSSLDVSHGFELDGYPIHLIARKGVTFQENTWNPDADHAKANWTRVGSVKFVAHRSGKFIFRCTQICGNLHPFMTGEMIVTPNIPYILFVALSIWVVFAMLVLMRHKKGAVQSGFRHINLLEAFPRLKRVIKLRSFHFLILLPNFIVFYLFILSSLTGSPVGNRNIAIVFVWILWWFALKAIFVPLGGRLWCLMCPLPAPAEWISRKRLTTVKYISKPLRGLHHRFSGLQKEWPRKLRNGWLQNILFLILISFGMILITRPIATALLFLVILVASVVLVLIYRNRVFCKYLCPVGGFLGTYSMASMTEIRAVDREICKKHKQKTCYTGGLNGWACPWNQYIGNMDRNTHCGMCTECIKSCPKDNVGIFIRPFGSDKTIRDYSELFNVMIMLVVAIAFSLTMLGPWGFIKDAANITESRQFVPFLLYLAGIWGSALLIFPGLFIMISRASNRLAGRPVPGRLMTLQLAYILIPLGIFAWIAFSLPAIMVNYGYIVSVLSDPLGLGWDMFNTADSHFKALIPEWIPSIQGVILLCGLYFGLSRGFYGLRRLSLNHTSQFRAMILPSLFALIVVNVLLKIYLG